MARKQLQAIVHKFALEVTDHPTRLPTLSSTVDRHETRDLYLSMLCCDKAQMWQLIVNRLATMPISVPNNGGKNWAMVSHKKTGAKFYISLYKHGSCY